MSHDIFLSYRRQDAEPHAWMLYRDLTAAGYPVFFDRELPGDAPQRQAALERCTDVVVLLSHETFGPRMQDDRDPVRRQIAWALAHHRHLVCIELSGFEALPDPLPADLAGLAQAPRLNARGHRYTAMLHRLLTEQLEGTTVGSFKPDSAPDDRLSAFARDMETDRLVELRNRNQEKMELTLHRMARSALEDLKAFQTEVVSKIPNVAETNLFQTLTEEELIFSLEHDICIGAYQDNQLVGLMVLLPNPTAEQNLLLDLPAFCRIDSAQILVVDAILVAGACRGFGLQKLFFRLADAISREQGFRYECCVVSPLNYHSMRNAVLSGFWLVGNFKKYASTRNFFVKDLDCME